MKTKMFRLLMLIGSPLLLLGGCNKNEIIYPEQNPEVVRLYRTIDQLIAEGVTVPGEEAEVAVRMKEDEKWTLEAQPGVALDEVWMTVDPAEGGRYSLITLRIGDNPHDVERTGILRFKVAGTVDPVDITVTQKAAGPVVMYDVEKLVYGVGKATQKLIVTTNVKNYSLRLTDKETGAEAGWLSLDADHQGDNPEVGKGIITYYLTAQLNKGGRLRAASFDFKSSDGTIFPLAVEQRETLETPVITLSNDDEFKLTWPSVVGAQGYKLHLRKGETPDSEQIGVIDINPSPNPEMSYNLDAVKWVDTYNYVGKVYCQLEAFLDFNDGETAPLELFSNIVGDHNFFDLTSGDGTPDDPYIVTKPRHVSNIRSFLDGNFRQTADIDCKDYPFVPISSGITKQSNIDYYLGEFTGSYDAGKGQLTDPSTGRTEDQYKITNLTISAATVRNVALFAETGTAAVLRNIRLENPNILGAYYVAALAGINRGRIVSCHTSGGNGVIKANITATATYYIGGLAGATYGDMEYCSNGIRVSGISGTNYSDGAGGIVSVAIVGSKDVNIRNCFNTGTVEGHASTAGIAGDVIAQNATILNMLRIEECYNKGEIISYSNNGQAAGMVGRNVGVGLEISRCWNSAPITAMGSAGGIMSRLAGGTAAAGGKPSSTCTLTIADCYNRGDVKTTGTFDNGNCNAAGILVSNINLGSTTVTIRNCYNTGSISAPAVSTAKGKFYTGLFQWVQAATQETNKTRFADTFTLEGEATMQHTYKYVSTDIPVGASFTFRNIPDADMRRQSTFTGAGWEFGSVWEMGSSYPKLRSLPE